MKMPTYDKTVLARKAQELGFNRDAYEKMSRLTEILRFIGNDGELGALLALKGGTAINLTVLNLPRLSVDIDMDFSENLTREETKLRRGRINELLSRYMAAEGYAPKSKSKQTHALDSFVYSYTNAAGNADNIKVEINYSLRCHTLPTVLAAVNASGAFADFSVRTLSPIEVFAGKIVALLGRGAARDLYDLNNMVCFGLFDEPDLTLLRKCAVLYRAVAGDAKTNGFDFTKLDDITGRMIRTDLHPVIRHTERFDFAAAKSRVSEFLTELMTLTDKERTFLVRFAEGHYEPELLSFDADILARIADHPMATWRIARIRREQQEK
ncbi:MAG: nucleotidyl transferase AbiEii/AbiGii toxin family protein [Clostridiales Family XIII bacterium]|jgi:predicted nucleotidyltransferase component of viral defense system|nr:nucleotidyl transferase AbiEii/AbiGii toxin family protein [Clostridiales Family XIII bacterium]